MTNPDNSTNQLQTPIAFMVFNRPSPTEKVFESIRAARPLTLLVVADGPRKDRPQEAELCRLTRKIIKKVDWPCDVRTNYSETNLGCRERISSGLKWVFEEVEEAIILEDDCLPHPSFFPYCEELLKKYRNDTRVGMISGDNFLPRGYVRDSSSFYFTKYTHIWGWASWRRAFERYDLAMREWPQLKASGWLEDFFHNEPTQVAHWRSIFDKVWSKEIDTWDYQLTYSFWAAGLTSICPAQNLVSNIGFGADATHTHEVNRFANLQTVPMKFPLQFPRSFSIDLLADEYSAEQIYHVPFFIPSPNSQLLFGNKYDSSSLSADEVSQYQNLQLQALQGLQADNISLALSLLNICNQRNVLLRDLHFFTAVCLVNLGDLVAAKRHLGFELTYFPDHVEAKDLYLKLSVDA